MKTSVESVSAKSSGHTPSVRVQFPTKGSSAGTLFNSDHVCSVLYTENKEFLICGPDWLFQHLRDKIGPQAKKLVPGYMADIVLSKDEARKFAASIIEACDESGGEGV